MRTSVLVGAAAPACAGGAAASSSLPPLPAQWPPAGGDEKTVDLAHLRDTELMRAYWADVRLFFRRARGAKTVVLHVEPDLWGYLEQAGAAARARSFAQQSVRLRDELAPNVLLAYHMGG